MIDFLFYVSLFSCVFGIREENRIRSCISHVLDTWKLVALDGI